jgi:hypothetical protein
VHTFGQPPALPLAMTGGCSTVADTKSQEIAAWARCIEEGAPTCKRNDKCVIERAGFLPSFLRDRALNSYREAQQRALVAMAQRRAVSSSAGTNEVNRRNVPRVSLCR